MVKFKGKTICALGCFVFIKNNVIFCQMIHIHAFMTEPCETKDNILFV